MLKIKVLLLSVLAVFAVAAVASSSASALIWGECSSPANGSGEGILFPTQADCEAGTDGGSGTWELLPLLGTVLVPSKGGTQKLTAESGGTTIVEIECSGVKDSVDFFNANDMGEDEVLETVYTGCKVKKPGSCAYVSSTNKNVNGEIALAEGVNSLLVTEDDVTEDEILQNASGLFVDLRIEKAEGDGKPCTSLKINDEVTGSVLAKVNNATQEFEFEGKSGSKLLEVDGFMASYTGNDKNEGTKDYFAFEP